MPSPSGRLARPPAWNATVPRQLLWFMLVGALSTVLQTIVYVSVREILAATWASWLALLVVTPANTEAHRRITFNVTTTAIGRLHWEAGLTSVVVYLANLAAAPWFAGIAGPHPSSLTESLMLALTGSLVGGVRYVILRGWVFAARRHTPAAASAPVSTPASTPASSPADSPHADSPHADSLQADSLQAGSSLADSRSATVAPAGDTRPARRNALRGRALRFRPNAAPAQAATPVAAVTNTPGPAATAVAQPDASGAASREVPVLTGTFPAYPSTGNITAALACLGTFAPIPTDRLCLSQPNTGVLNQRPPGRLRTWHRNRRQHLTARS
ncbi:GtrA family protein [Actinoplanes sp. HUAS TT8]|uniref:GtrA family protein n=1 Tax=Actinoplanes sp. HUAS TT8 TaxID=3447453 RepID=UPI003F5276F7